MATAIQLVANAVPLLVGVAVQLGTLNSSVARLRLRETDIFTTSEARVLPVVIRYCSRKQISDRADKAYGLILNRGLRLAISSDS